tara:strand:- start:3339 stop:3515 length:177 start_codon:yes stop_codon:yes gene_type:complete
MTMIYESPDKGKTVYERPFGAPLSERKLVKQEPSAVEDAANAMAQAAYNDKLRKEKLR